MPTSIFNALFTGSEPVILDGNVIAAATLSVTAALHAGRTILLGASGGFTCTLPAATGSGVEFLFQVSVVSTTGYLIATSPTTDIFQGGICTGIDNATTGKSFMAASNSNLITFNGTTKGGVTIGDAIWVQDILAGVWAVGGQVVGSGTIVTPFSHV